MLRQVKQSVDPEDGPEDQEADILAMGVLALAVGPVVRLLRNQLAARIVYSFAPFGLRAGSFSSMALIAANPGCSQSDVARETGIDKSVVVAIVDVLEARGLARRERSRQDRRRNALYLTEAGHALLADMHGAGMAMEQPIREALTREEFETLLALNRKALNAMMATEGS